MNESGVLDHGLRSAHEPPSTSVGGGQRLIAPQHLTPAATAQGSERKRPAAPSGGSRSGQLRGDDMYSNSESGRPAKTMVAAPSSALAHHVRPPPRDPPASRLPAFPVRRRSPNRALDHHLSHLALSTARSQSSLRKRHGRSLPCCKWWVFESIWVATSSVRLLS